MAERTNKVHSKSFGKANSQSKTLSGDTPPSAPTELSLLVNLRRDGGTLAYSYASAWSTNYTMSNLPGTGRLLGNLYSRAGSSLERGIGSLANLTGLGGYAKAKEVISKSYYTILFYERGKGWSEMEKAWDTLVRHAGCVLHRI